MLQEMFGEESVPKMFKGDKLHVTVDNKRADIDLLNMVCTSFFTLIIMIRRPPRPSG